MKDPKIFCAIDTADLDLAKDLSAKVANAGCGIKLGLEFVSGCGLGGIEAILKIVPNVPVFLDMKYHDIPNTVSGAVKTITHHFEPAYLNIHASGGIEMMEAAKKACHPKTKLLGVTVLTSLSAENLETIGFRQDPENQVKRLAEITSSAGLDGVICSAHEIKMLRILFGNEFILMVPGIRMEGDTTGDQKRTMTPQKAMETGATHLVIGRPITQAQDPQKAAEDILTCL